MVSLEKWGKKVNQSEVDSIVNEKLTPMEQEVSTLKTNVGTNTSNISNLTTELGEVKNSVSDGKTRVATAITGKGQTTAATATFAEMATNIGKISTLASETNDGTISAGDIVKDKIGYSKGSRIVGTMVNNGAVSATLSLNGTYTIPAGYHNGSGTVTQSITTDSSSGTYYLYSDGSSKSFTGGRYYSSTHSVQANITNLYASNIKSGVTVGGVTGTYSGTNTTTDSFPYSNFFQADTDVTSSDATCTTTTFCELTATPGSSISKYVNVFPTSKPLVGLLIGGKYGGINVITKLNIMLRYYDKSSKTFKRLHSYTSSDITSETRANTMCLMPKNTKSDGTVFPTLYYHWSSSTESSNYLYIKSYSAIPSTATSTDVTLVFGGIYYY